MLSSRTQSLLAHYLKSVAEVESSVEITRLVLAEKRDFKPLSAFCSLDRFDRECLNVRDLTEFLNEVDIFPSESVVLSYIRLYSSTDGIRLSYSDFKNAVLPSTDLYLREVALGRPIFRSDQPLPYSALWALARIFEKDMESLKSLEYRSKELVERYDWDTSAAFRALDKERYGYIDSEAVRLYFDECGLLITSKEVEALFRRADKDADGKIDISEFLKLLNPMIERDTNKSIASPGRKNRSPSPRRLESTFTIQSTPKRLSKDKVESINISDADYYRYLSQSARMSSPRGNSTRLSPRQSPRNRSPSLRKELTDYRFDSGYRTVRKYDSTDQTRVSPQINQDSPLSISAKPRSRSPRFRSEVTDYRVTSNSRTVKSYNNESPLRESAGSFNRGLRNEDQMTPVRQSDQSYNLSYGSERKRSPIRYAQEPTTYREETGYRTVRIYDRNEPQLEKEQENESGMKEYSEEPRTKQSNEEINKKLNYEDPQQEKKEEIEENL